MLRGPLRLMRAQLYLRELPEPVFKFSLADRIQHTEDRGEKNT
jgi:hypothetical protein